MFAEAFLTGQVQAIGQWLRRSGDMAGAEGSILNVAATLKKIEGLGVVIYV